MSYQKLIDKLKSSDNQKEETTTSNSNERKLAFLEFKEPSSLRFRVLPNKKDPDDVPFERVFIHLGFEHPNFAKRVPLLCKGKDCPMCSFYKKRTAGGDKDAWKYKSNQRFIYYVEYEDAKGQLKLALLSLTYYAQESLKNKMIAQLKAGVNIFDLQDGRWLDMTMKKIGDKRTYTVGVETESDTVTDMDILDWYKVSRPLHQFYKEYTMEDLKKILKGEKIEVKGGSPNSQPNPTNNTNKSSLKKPEAAAAGMKFDSDEVESIDSNIPDVSDETPQNMKRLEDIMNRTDEDDFE